jgi:hypothetical protein
MRSAVVSGRVEITRATPAHVHMSVGGLGEFQMAVVDLVRALYELELLNDALRVIYHEKFNDA